MQLDDKLSPHFTLRELIRSEYASRHELDNTPPGDIIPKLQVVAEGLERIRTLIGAPISVQSGYRAPKVNAGVGGSVTSQHMKGEAADINAVGYSPRSLAELVRKAQATIQFDQLILEYPDAGGWVHVSFVAGRAPRGQILTKRTGKPYEIGLA